MPLDYAYRVSPESISVHCLPSSPHAGAFFTWSNAHPSYDKVLELIRARAPSADLFPLMNLINAVNEAFMEHGNITVTREGVHYKGKLIHNALTQRIMQTIELDLDVTPTVLFMDKLFQNPRREAVISLFDFLEKNNVPLTEEGNFVAYKKVRSDYMDCYSGTIDNHPGQEPTVEPWEVDADRDNACSSGLHVCSKEYLPHFGGQRIVVVEVNPAHVVAVPRDYNCAKMRVYKYKVIGELTDQTTGIGGLEKSPITMRSPTPGVDWFNIPKNDAPAGTFDDDVDPDDDDDEDWNDGYI